MEVFRGHGKIYEASASAMFGIPLEEITKDSPWRARGKVAELALGYQGALGAMKAMGAERLGLTEPEILSIVKQWRRASPNIVSFWYDVEGAAMRAMETRKPVTLVQYRGLVFHYNGEVLRIKLPSGRCLYYWEPKFYDNKFGRKAIKYWVKNQETNKWQYTGTYGGKLGENIVQAAARDLLAFAMLNLERAGFEVQFHVHDEPVTEEDEVSAEDRLRDMCEIMVIPPDWAPDIPLKAAGFTTPFYQK